LTEVEANAQLIAAAPDLYEACNWMAEFIHSLYAQYGPKYQVQQQKLGLVRKALAKAEGK